MNLFQLAYDHSTILLMLIGAMVQSMETPKPTDTRLYKYVFTLAHSVMLIGIPRVLNTKDNWDKDHA